jgi:hypothetical protein
MSRDSSAVFGSLVSRMHHCILWWHCLATQISWPPCARVFLVERLESQSVRENLVRLGSWRSIPGVKLEILTKFCYELLRLISTHDYRNCDFAVCTEWNTRICAAVLWNAEFPHQYVSYISGHVRCGGPLRTAVVSKVLACWRYVHWHTPNTILMNNQLDAQFVLYIFISILYMFRATLCSSSGASIVSVQQMVYVTLCR